MKINQDTLNALRYEASVNPTFKDLCYVLADRQRARNRFTVVRMIQSMEEKGFKYPRQKYEDIVRFLSKLGFGTIVYSPRGKVRALDKIPVKLQSIGKVALEGGKIAEFKTVKKTVNRYEKLVVEQDAMHNKTFVEEPIALKPKTVAVERQYPVFLAMMLEGKLINISGQTKVTANSIEELVNDFKQISNKEASK